MSSCIRRYSKETLYRSWWARCLYNNFNKTSEWDTASISFIASFCGMFIFLLKSFRKNMLKNIHKFKPGSWHSYDLTAGKNGVWERGVVSNNICGIFHELIILVLELRYMKFRNYSIWELKVIHDEDWMLSNICNCKQENENSKRIWGTRKAFPKLLYY